ncbi:hypothetical protein HDV00_009075 [Rhizophlyctis rosea]|nr:hypothetical protein HDV00_009075 [Rhizophlyctis rosea]
MNDGRLGGERESEYRREESRQHTASTSRAASEVNDQRDRTSPTRSKTSHAEKRRSVIMTEADEDDVIYDDEEDYNSTAGNSSRRESGEYGEARSMQGDPSGSADEDTDREGEEGDRNSDRAISEERNVGPRTPPGEPADDTEPRRANGNHGDQDDEMPSSDEKEMSQAVTESPESAVRDVHTAEDSADLHPSIAGATEHVDERRPDMKFNGVENREESTVSSTSSAGQSQSNEDTSAHPEAESRQEEISASIMKDELSINATAADSPEDQQPKDEEEGRTSADKSPETKPALAAAVTEPVRISLVSSPTRQLSTESEVSVAAEAHTSPAQVDANKDSDQQGHEESLTSRMDVDDGPTVSVDANIPRTPPRGPRTPEPRREVDVDVVRDGGGRDSPMRVDDEDLGVGVGRDGSADDHRATNDGRGRTPIPSGSAKVNTPTTPPRPASDSYRPEPRPASLESGEMVESPEKRGPVRPSYKRKASPDDSAYGRHRAERTEVRHPPRSAYSTADDAGYDRRSGRGDDGARDLNGRRKGPSRWQQSEPVNTQSNRSSMDRPHRRDSRDSAAATTTNTRTVMDPASSAPDRRGITTSSMVVRQHDMKAHHGAQQKSPLTKEQFYEALQTALTSLASQSPAIKRQDSHASGSGNSRQVAPAPASADTSSVRRKLEEVADDAQPPPKRRKDEGREGRSATVVANTKPIWNPLNVVTSPPGSERSFTKTQKSQSEYTRDIRHLCVNGGSLYDALALLEDMEEEGVTRTADQFREVMREASRRKDVEALQAVFEQYQAAFAETVTSQDWGILLMGIARGGDGSRLRSFVAEAEGQNVAVDYAALWVGVPGKKGVDVMRVLLSGLEKNINLLGGGLGDTVFGEMMEGGLSKEILRLFKVVSGVERAGDVIGRRTAEELVEYFLRIRNFGAVFDVLKWAGENGVGVDERKGLALFVECCSRGKLGALVDKVYLLVKKHYQLTSRDLSTFETAIKGLLDTSQTSKALQIFSDFPTLRLPLPSTDLLNDLLTRSAAQNTLDAFVTPTIKLLEPLDESAVDAYAKFITDLTSACVEQRLRKEAAALYEFMKSHKLPATPGLSRELMAFLDEEDEASPASEGRRRSLSAAWHGYEEGDTSGVAADREELVRALSAAQSNREWEKAVDMYDKLQRDGGFRQRELAPLVAFEVLVMCRDDRAAVDAFENLRGRTEVKDVCEEVLIEFLHQLRRSRRFTFAEMVVKECRKAGTGITSTTISELIRDFSTEDGIGPGNVSLELFRWGTALGHYTLTKLEGGMIPAEKCHSLLECKFLILRNLEYMYRLFTQGGKAYPNSIGIRTPPEWINKDGVKIYLKDITAVIASWLEDGLRPSIRVARFGKEGVNGKVYVLGDVVKGWVEGFFGREGRRNVLVFVPEVGEREGEEGTLVGDVGDVLISTPLSPRKSVDRPPLPHPPYDTRQRRDSIREDRRSDFPASQARRMTPPVPSSTSPARPPPARPPQTKDHYSPRRTSADPYHPPANAASSYRETRSDAGSRADHWRPNDVREWASDVSRDTYEEASRGAGGLVMHDERDRRMSNSDFEKRLEGVVRDEMKQHKQDLDKNAKPTSALPRTQEQYRSVCKHVHADVRAFYRGNFTRISVDNLRRVVAAEVAKTVGAGGVGGAGEGGGDGRSGRRGGNSGEERGYDDGGGSNGGGYRGGRRRRSDARER